MKANSDKSQLLLRTEAVLAVNINENVAFNSKMEKLHGVTIARFSTLCQTEPET